MPTKNASRDIGCCRPQSGGLICASANYVLAIMRKSNCFHTRLMTNEPASFLPALHVPQPDRFIITTGESKFAIWRERYIIHRASVSAERADFRPRFSFPQSRNPVTVAYQHILSIWRVCHACHSAVLGLSPKDLKFLASCCLPNTRCGVRASREHIFAVR